MSNDDDVYKMLEKTTHEGWATTLETLQGKKKNPFESFIMVMDWMIK